MWVVRCCCKHHGDVEEEEQNDTQPFCMNALQESGNIRRVRSNQSPEVSHLLHHCGLAHSDINVLVMQLVIEFMNRTEAPTPAPLFQLVSVRDGQMFQSKAFSNLHEGNYCRNTIGDLCKSQGLVVRFNGITAGKGCREPTDYSSDWSWASDQRGHASKQRLRRAAYTEVYSYIYVNVERYRDAYTITEAGTCNVQSVDGELPRVQQGEFERMAQTPLQLKESEYIMVA